MSEALQGEFLIWLAGERRAAAKTVETYARDVAAFLAFCTKHVGDDPDVAMLGALRPADIRAWLAQEAKAGGGQ